MPEPDEPNPANNALLELAMQYSERCNRLREEHLDRYANRLSTYQSVNDRIPVTRQ